VGLGTAANLAEEEYVERRMNAANFRKQLLEALGQVNSHINGDPCRSQLHVLSVHFPGVDSEALMLGLREIAALSNGSACSTSSYSPSHVLAAMGCDAERIDQSVRISWGESSEPLNLETLIQTVRGLQEI
jgi:cysteine desulfurase